MFKRSASNIASIEPHWTGSDRVGRRCRRGRIRAGQTGMQPDVRACSGRTWSVGIALQDHWNGRPLPGGFDSPASAARNANNRAGSSGLRRRLASSTSRGRDPVNRQIHHPAACLSALRQPQSE